MLAEAVRAARTVARLHPSGVHAAQRATRRAQGRRKRRAAAPPKAHALTRLPGLLVLDQQVLGEAAVQVGHCRDQGLDSLDRSMLLGRWRDVELGEQRLELSWDRHAVTAAWQSEGGATLSGMHRGSWDTLLGGGEAESSMSSTSHVCLCLSPSWRPDRWLAAATSSLLRSALRGHRQCSDTAHSSRECTAASPTCQWRLPRTPIRLPCLHQGVQEAGMSVCEASVSTWAAQCRGGAEPADAGHKPRARRASARSAPHCTPSVL